MKHFIDKFEKDTGLKFYTTNIDNGEDLYSCDFVSWLIKQLTLNDVVKSFYCYDETVQIAEETGDKIIKCDKQCEKCE